MLKRIGAFFNATSALWVMIAMGFALVTSLRTVGNGAEYELARRDAAAHMGGVVVGRIYQPGHGNFLASASPETFYIEVQGVNPLTKKTEVSVRAVPKDVWDDTRQGDKVQGD